MNPMWKTRLCKFVSSGQCSNGKDCIYAHGEEELRSSPDFTKTSMCPMILQGKTCRKSNCRFAHSREELREIPGLLKTKMFQFQALGQCMLGSRCRFAHDPEELTQAIEFGLEESVNVCPLVDETPRQKQSRRQQQQEQKKKQVQPQCDASGALVRDIEDLAGATCLSSRPNPQSDGSQDTRPCAVLSLAA